MAIHFEDEQPYTVNLGLCYGKCAAGAGQIPLLGGIICPGIPQPRHPGLTMSQVILPT